jgi:hypothetical protein
MPQRKYRLFDSHVSSMLSTSNLRDKDTCGGPGGTAGNYKAPQIPSTFTELFCCYVCNLARNKAVVPDLTPFV